MPEIVWKAGQQSPDDPLEFIMSTATPDSMGDIVEQNWQLRDFRKNPIALWQHNSSRPIGTWENVRVVDGQLRGVLKLAREGTSELINEIRSLLEQRILRAVSVGFLPTKQPERLDDGGFRFPRSRLLECSLVSVPANAEALALAKSLGLSDDRLDSFFGEPARGRKSLASDPADSGLNRSGRKRPRIRGKPIMPVKISERIVALEDDIKKDQGALQEIIDAAEQAEEGYTEEVKAQIDELSAEIAEKTEQLKSLQKAERALAIKAVAKEEARGALAPGGRLHAVPAKKEEPGALLVKAAVCAALGYVKTRNAIDVCKEIYPDDPRIEAIVKDATSPADSTTSTWAAELVQEQVAGFVSLLTPISIFARLREMGIPLEFGRNGTIRIPRDASSPTQLGGGWVGEGTPIHTARGAFGQLILARYKLGVIVPYTREIGERSIPAIEGLLREQMLTSTANVIDSKVVSADAAVSGVSPAGLLNGVAETTTGGGTDLDAIRGDLQKLVTVLVLANSWRMPVWILNPKQGIALRNAAWPSGGWVFRAEMAAGVLNGAPYIESTNCPADTIILLDAADFVSGVDLPAIDKSREATIVMADTGATEPTAPLRVDEAAGQTPPAQVHSLFQMDQEALRLLWPATFGQRRSGVLAWMGSIGW